MLIHSIVINIFSEMVRHSRCRYTERHLERCSKLSGAFGRDVARLLSLSMGLSTSKQTSSHQLSPADVRSFVLQYLPDALLSYIPGREATGLQLPDREQPLRSPDRLGDRLRELSLDKDFWASQREADEV